MKAIVYDRYGPPEVLRLADLPKPVPGKGEILIAVRASTVTSADWRARSLAMPRGMGLLGRLVFGLRGPRKPVLGMDFAGVVAAVGEGARIFRPGDEVFGIDSARMGAHAEFKVIPERAAVIAKPHNVSFVQAAALPFGGTAALYFLRDKARLRAGERVLIIGASGAVGTAAVQIAKQLGAHVTGVCGPDNLAMVRGLGADQVIDYTAQDFTTNGEAYDIILAVNRHATMAECKGSLTQGGRLVLVLASLGQLLWPAKTGSKRTIVGVAPEKADDLRVLAELAEAGALTPVIDAEFPLAQAARAHARVDSGHKRGNVVLRIGGD